MGNTYSCISSWAETSLHTGKRSQQQPSSGGSLQTPYGEHCVLQWFNVGRITAPTCLCYCFFFFFFFFFFVKLFCGSYLKGVSNLSTLVLLWLKLNTLTSLNLSPTFPWTTSLKAYFERLQKAWGGASGALQTGKKWAVLALPDGAVWFFF